MRILLAEDDPSQAQSIQAWLNMDGYVVDWVQRGDYALSALQQHHYDCVLLDRGLPYASGDQVLKQLRQHHQQTAVIFITARDTISDRVDGLDLGANDYLVKPFSLEELSARIRSQLRQQQSHPQQHELCYGALRLDPQAKIAYLHDEILHLTGKEFQILHKLLQHPEHIVTRAQLEESLYAWGDEIESNAIEVFIYQLRKKIGAQTIKTVRGLGYRMQQVP